MVRACIRSQVVAAVAGALCLSQTAAQAQTVTMTNPTPIAIPGGGGGSPGDPYPSSITMSGLTGPVCKVVVTLHGLSHTWTGDIDILLVAPNGQTCVLLSDVGDPHSVVNATLVFDDNAPSVPSTFASGTFRPTNEEGFDGDAFETPAPPGPYGSVLDSFNGMSAATANGQWRLFVRDDYVPDDHGLLAGGWSLSITQGIVVTNTNTSGAGSLRQAILDANANADLSFICFNIPGAGPHTISPGSGGNSLPAITQPVVIDGLSQPDAFCDGTWPPTIQIILDGSSAPGGAVGLNITGGGSTVRGLQIQNFPMDGIRLATGDGNKVQSCFVIGNGRDGVCVESGSEDNLIGVESKLEASACQRNLISNNARAGVLLDTAGNIVAGNYIGTSASGLEAMGNAREGVFISGNCNRVGTDGDGFADDLERNIISANLRDGVVIDQAEGNVVAGNFIGVGADGTTPLGNGTMATHNGVMFSPSSPNNRVGTKACTPNPAEGNIIAFNAGNGIDMTGGGSASIRNAFLMNSIHSNGGLGICFVPPGPTPNDPQDADIGANMRQNHPIITSADGVTIDGTFNSRPNYLYRLEFFANSVGDPSGFGEGETFVAATVVMTDASGDATFSVAYTPAPGKPIITATATNIGRAACDPPHVFCIFEGRGAIDNEIYNTSEFSPWVEEARSSCELTCTDIEVYANTDRCEAEVDFGQIVPEACLENGYFLVCTIDDGMGGTMQVESGDTFPVGDTTVTCVLYDSEENVVDECTFVVTVINVDMPTIVCPDDIVTATDPGVCRATVAFAPTIVEPCDSTPGVYDLICTVNGVEITSPHFFPVGTTTVQCCIYPTALGGNGEPGAAIDCCTFTVTVEDREAPTFTCQNLQVLVRDCEPIVLDPEAIFEQGISDNCCDQFTINLSPVTFVCPPLGPDNAVTVTVTVTDCNGNTATCSIEVTFVGPDCNNNGLSDYCDICQGTSLDCNNNWVPDECECYWCQGDLGESRGTVIIPDVNAQLSHVGGGAPDGARVADDFYLEPGCLHRISAFRGRLLNNSIPQLRRARLEFYEDCNGKPAATPFATYLSAEVATITDVQPAQDGFYVLTYRFDLCDKCLWLEGGRTYWVSLVGLSDNITDDLSYWIATEPDVPIMGSVPCKADGTRISWTQWTWGPWMTIEECCIGCVNFEFCLDGYRCPIIWDNGGPNLGAGRGGSASGAHQAGETRTADSFLTKTQCPDGGIIRGGETPAPIPGICPGEQEICLIEAWIWTNCDPVHGFIELYRDLPCGPPELENAPFVVYSGDQIEATRFDETWVANNQTHRLWRLRVKDPNISLCYCTNYWVSAGAYSTGSFVVNSYFANAVRGCDPCATPHAFRITPGQFRSIRPQSTQWADVNPKRDFAFRIAGRDPGMILSDTIGQGPTATPACVADANNDGQVTVEDIFAFLSAWFAGCP